MKIILNSIEELIELASLLGDPSIVPPTHTRTGSTTTASSAEPRTEAGGDSASNRAPAERPEDVIIHWGKQQGEALGDLTLDGLKWWATVWQPKPYKGEMNPADTKLKAAAERLYERIRPEEDIDDIPF